MAKKKNFDRKTFREVFSQTNFSAPIFCFFSRKLLKREREKEKEEKNNVEESCNTDSIKSKEIQIPEYRGESFRRNESS